jgi:acyl-coenzyme A synthetase/AMP-(fatty) acid ligase
MAVNQVIREDREAFSSLRILHTGGDVLTPVTGRDIVDSGFGGRFFNLYGPSETTTACTSYAVEAVPLDADNVPIGRALDGTTTYVLDAQLNPVAPGTAGELHVGGAGLARGYLGSPRLTADRFLPDPVAGAGARMYATGDLVRERADGLLEFLGRADDQVKIRGYRVEPGEVERALAHHPDLREVGVLTVGDGEDRRLVAVVVPHDTVSLRELRGFAENKLPHFMVPSELLVVSEIPSNDHGKRERSALRHLVEAHRKRRSDPVPLGDEVERYVGQLWEDLLAVELIGATDDFFQLGGHSLLAFRVQRAIKRDLGVALEFQDILGNTVLQNLAAVIRTRQGADS